MGIYLDRANSYIDNILFGKLVVNDAVKRACLRQRDDLRRQRTNEFPYFFDEARAELPCKFIEKFSHVKGIWRGKPFQLEPFQCFIITTIFGWHFANNPRKRRFNLVYIELPRKNGKSILAGGICLYCLMVDDLEPSPEIYIGATSLDQAGEVFIPCKDMIDSAPLIKKLFGVECFAKSIKCKKSGGFIKAVISKGKDGKSPSLFVIDEYHQAPTKELLESFKTGLGSRPSGFGVIVTTAGVDLESPCKEMHDDMLSVLNGSVPEERDFAIIYTIPENMDRKDFEAWKLANPNYGISVDEDFLAKQYRDAMTKPGQQNDIFTKNLNIWCSVDSAWMNMAKLDGCVNTQLNPDSFVSKGLNCVVGLDLAEKLDLIAAVLCFYDDTQVWAFPKFYLPTETMDRDPRDIYPKWANMGLLTLCPGEVVDYEYVRKDLDLWRERFKANIIAYDPWHASQFILSLVNDGYKCIEVKPNVAIMSEAMKQCEADIYSKKFHFDGNQMLKWNFANVVGHYDSKGNIFPRKQRRQNKIDGVVALLTAYDTIMRERNKPKPVSPGMIFF